MSKVGKKVEIMMAISSLLGLYTIFGGYNQPFFKTVVAVGSRQATIAQIIMLIWVLTMVFGGMILAIKKELGQPKKSH